MAILQTLRVKLGVVISIIIALSLLSFIIDTNTLDSALSSMSKKNDVGQVAGKSVSYTEFQEEVDKFTTINQIMTGSTVQDEQTQNQIRNAAWQGFIDKYLFIKNAKEAGITVGEDELIDLISGDNVSPIIAQNPMFQDENGAFSLEALDNFRTAMEQDQTGQYKTFWNYLQNTVYTQQYYAKYGSLFSNGSVLNKLMEDAAIADNNTTFDIDYVVAQYPFTQDTTIQVSSNEIKAYYDNHKKNYKQLASRDIEYVVFEVVPSEADIEEVSTSMANLVEEFATTSNVKNFLLKNSDRSYSEYWYKDDELKTVNAELSDFVKANAPGAVSPVFRSGNSFYSVKVLAEAQMPDQIQVKIMPAAEAVMSDSLITALRLLEPMQMTQSYLIPGCESLFSSKLNTPEFIKTAQYGTLIAEVVEKSEPVAKKQVAIFEKTALPSKTTYNEFYAKANKFAGITAGTYEGYLKAVDSTKVYSHPMNNVLESTASYGSVDQAKEVTRWIYDNKKGKASNIITVNTNYFFVVALKEIHKEGYTPIKEVAAGIRENLYEEKLFAKVLDETKAKAEGLTDLEAIAEAVGGSVMNREGVAFASNNGPMLEPALLGAAAAAKDGEVCGPVKGQMGVYYFTVKNRQTGSFYTLEDAKNFEKQKAQYSSQMILPVMMESADVKDNRARFF